MVNVPVDELIAPIEVLADPPVMLPVMVQLLPLAKLDVKQVELAAPPATTPNPVNVNVIPLTAANPPPAVTPVALALLILNTVGLVSIVTVNVLLYTSSDDVGSAPVFHTVVSDQTPVFRARTIAIRAPSHQ
jgi:hypothetical protein